MNKYNTKDIFFAIKIGTFDTDGFSRAVRSPMDVKSDNFFPILILVFAVL
jgi:hypothetical protein